MFEKVLRVTLVVCVMCVVLGLAAAVRAEAVVTWGPKVNINTVGDSIINTEGTLVTAINFGSDVTVNGVPFRAATGNKPLTEPGFTDLYRVSSQPGYPLNPNNNMSTELRSLLNSMAYDDDWPIAPPVQLDIALQGLEVGKNYLVQFLVSDERSGGYSSWEQSYTSGGSTAGPYTCMDTYSLIGRWVADGTSQAFTISQPSPTHYPGKNQSLIINAIQWRKVGSSTPSNYVWTSVTDQGWNTGTNWDGGVFPNGAGYTVSAGSAGTQGAITVSGASKFGQLTLNGNVPVTMAGSGSGELIFEKGGLAAATLIVEHGTTHTDAISAPITLNDSLTVKVLNASDELHLSSTITGAGASLTLDASNLGKVVLGNATTPVTNLYDGGTIVNGGTLEVANANALPAGQALTIGAGSKVVLSSGLGAAGASGAATSATAVPEPGTIALLAAGLAGLLAAAWRRRR